MIAILYIMRYIVSMFGRKHVYDLSTEDIIQNVCDTVIGYADNEYMDGYREQRIALDDYINDVYAWCVSHEVEIYMDGMAWTMPTPKEVRFYGEKGIKEFARKTYIEFYGA